MYTRLQDPAFTKLKLCIDFASLKHACPRGIYISPVSEEPLTWAGVVFHPAHSSPPHIVEVLQYLRVAFDTEALLDSLPLDAAANSGAWHAWKSHRAKSMPRSASPVTRPSRGISEASREQTLSSRNQQPGGARRPGEWNWQGVWEDRVRKSIIASNSEPVLFGAEGNDVPGSGSSQSYTRLGLSAWQYFSCSALEVTSPSPKISTRAGSASSSIYGTSQAKAMANKEVRQLYFDKLIYTYPDQR
ncbi:hypothetical protein B0A50_00319 [Salinomyces thailandicus]|uniref:Uncharacterized protein n=1 Tax=Salinomyces thailandicus TaxID=706561 RepID=A0A4U0UFK4_9PEZI|nr:hypothetical protein B0A50_00319 [Salinomyces thailandica]